MGNLNHFSFSQSYGNSWINVFVVRLHRLVWAYNCTLRRYWRLEGNLDRRTWSKCVQECGGHFVKMQVANTLPISFQLWSNYMSMDRWTWTLRIRAAGWEGNTTKLPTWSILVSCGIWHFCLFSCSMSYSLPSIHSIFEDQTRVSSMGWIWLEVQLGQMYMWTDSNQMYMWTAVVLSYQLNHG